MADYFASRRSPAMTLISKEPGELSAKSKHPMEGLVVLLLGPCLYLDPLRNLRQRRSVGSVALASFRPRKYHN